MRKFFPWPAVASLVLLVVAAAVFVTLRHRAEPVVATPVDTATPPGAQPATPPVQATTEPPLIGPGGFVPLQSQAVKDAIHRALETGTTQRWQDGALSGYAVPSLTAGANGCRAIRYTIDRQPGAAYGSITACDASAH